jgi:hypothetical protein
MGEIWNVHRIFVEKHLGKYQLGRRRKRWEEGNIRMSVRETGCGNWTWMEVAQVRVQLRALALAASNHLVLLPHVK